MLETAECLLIPKSSLFLTKLDFIYYTIKNDKFGQEYIHDFHLV